MDTKRFKAKLMIMNLVQKVRLEGRLPTAKGGEHF